MFGIIEDAYKAPEKIVRRRMTRSTACEQINKNSNKNCSLKTGFNWLFDGSRLLNDKLQLISNIDALDIDIIQTNVNKLLPYPVTTTYTRNVKNELITLTNQELTTPKRYDLDIFFFENKYLFSLLFSYCWCVGMSKYQNDLTLEQLFEVDFSYIDESKSYDTTFSKYITILLRLTRRVKEYVEQSNDYYFETLLSRAQSMLNVNELTTDVLIMVSNMLQYDAMTFDITHIDFDNVIGYNVSKKRLNLYRNALNIAMINALQYISSKGYISFHLYEYQSFEITIKWIFNHISSTELSKYSKFIHEEYEYYGMLNALNIVTSNDTFNDFGFKCKSDQFISTSSSNSPFFNYSFSSSQDLSPFDKSPIDKSPTDKSPSTEEYTIGEL